MEGLKVACGVFTISNAKDRKVLLKHFKGKAKEMAIHPIASLFLLKVISSYDDTVTCKKYIVNDLVTNFEELIQDDPEKIVEWLYCGIFDLKLKHVFWPEISEIFEISKEHTTSRKDDDVRR